MRLLILLPFVVLLIVPVLLAQGVVSDLKNGQIHMGLFGAVVHGGWDVNLDGYDDYLVASPGADRVQVFSGASGAQLFEMTGEVSGDSFGSSAAFVPDLDGDGHPEILIGAQYHSSFVTHGGRAYLYSGATGQLLATRSSQHFGARFGYSVGSAGDIDGDGTHDIMVGAPYEVIPAMGFVGAVFVFSGESMAPILALYGENADDLFGCTLTQIGDANGDGKDDVVIGARWNDQNGNNAGKIYFYSGLSGIPYRLRWGENGGDQFGSALSNGGDINGDGVLDVIVGAMQHDAFGIGNPGRAYAYSGFDGALLHVWNGTLQQERLGAAVAITDDLDGDGLNDVLISAPIGGSTLQGTGQVTAYSGLTGSLLFAEQGEALGDVFGSSISAGGDMNGDGHSEILVSALGVAVGGQEVGRTYAISAPGVVAAPFLGPIGNGNIGLTYGAPYDVLFVNNSSGGALHRVDVSRWSYGTIHVNQPLTNPVPAWFSIFGFVGCPTYGDAFLLPGTPFSMAFVPPPLAPWDPRMFLLADSSGAGVLAAHPAPWLRVFPNGLPGPVAVTFQGLIAEDPLSIRMTNAVIMNID